MKTLLISYFSGTGNTKKVVLEFKKSFEEKGVAVTLHNIEEPLSVNISDFDAFAVAYPVHAFNAPANVLQFAKTLKKMKFDKRPFFIIKTSGEPIALNNVSSLKLKSLLKKKFDFVGEFHYCMPYNIIFRHSNNMVFKMWSVAQACIPLDSQDIIDGKRNKIKYFPFGHFLAWVFRIEHWGGRFNGKHYKVNTNCAQCGACVKRCPTHNITLENGEFHFGKHCLMCMRCSFFCPKDAIKIGFFNKWKVNGAYNFNNFDENEIEKHKKYCRKAYIKYFAAKESKINGQKANSTQNP